MAVSCNQIGPHWKADHFVIQDLASFWNAGHFDHTNPQILLDPQPKEEKIFLIPFQESIIVRRSNIKRLKMLIIIIMI